MIIIINDNINNNNNNDSIINNNNNNNIYKYNVGLCWGVLSTAHFVMWSVVNSFRPWVRSSSSKSEPLGLRWSATWAVAPWVVSLIFACHLTRSQPGDSASWERPWWCPRSDPSPGPSCHRPPGWNHLEMIQWIWSGPEIQWISMFFLEAAMKSGPKECQDTSACAWRRARDLGAPNSSQVCSQLWRHLPHQPVSIQVPHSILMGICLEAIKIQRCVMRFDSCSS